MERNGKLKESMWFSIATNSLINSLLEWDSNQWYRVIQGGQENE